MGLLQRILGKEKKVSAPAYRTFTDGAPNFSTWDGPIYEQEITRACIERFATACSKMKPEVAGESCPDVRKAVLSRPNPIMTWPTFLKRLAAVYDSDGTAFVVPVYGSDGWSKVGFFPVKCEFAEVVEVAGDPWVRFSFAAGEQTALPLGDVCILSKLQVQSDFFGEPNCLRRTMQLIDAQNQAQDAAIRNGAKIRFIGSVPGMVKPEQLEEKRRLFMEGNLSSSNVSGMMVYDQTFLDVKQVEPQSYTMDSAEMERITSNVCNYFGMSAPVLTTNFTEDQFGAWYESKVEPFGVQLGVGLTNMCFSPVQQRHGNRLSFSSNRLEYASNASKRNMVRDMLDRGVFSINEAREVLQLPPVEGGDVRVVRGEYVNAAAVSSMVGVSGGGRMKKNVSDKNGEADLEGSDTFYKDSDAYGNDDFNE